jgi:ABC-type histidine transport system ATPase subunit
MLIVTHDMAMARDVANHVIFLHQGVIEEQGPPETLFGAPKITTASAVSFCRRLNRLNHIS